MKNLKVNIDSDIKVAKVITMVMIILMSLGVVFSGISFFLEFSEIAQFSVLGNIEMTIKNSSEFVNFFAKMTSLTIVYNLLIFLPIPIFIYMKLQQVSKTRKMFDKNDYKKIIIAFSISVIVWAVYMIIRMFVLNEFWTMAIDGETINIIKKDYIVGFSSYAATTEIYCLLFYLFMGIVFYMGNKISSELEEIV